MFLYVSGPWTILYEMACKKVRRILSYSSRPCHHFGATRILKFKLSCLFLICWIADVQVPGFLDVYFAVTHIAVKHSRIPRFSSHHRRRPVPAPDEPSDPNLRSPQHAQVSNTSSPCGHQKTVAIYMLSGNCKGLEALVRAAERPRVKKNAS